MGQFRKAPASRAHQSSTSSQAKPEAGRRRAPSTVWLLQASDDAGHCWSAAQLQWAGKPRPQECSALVLGELGGSQHPWAALLLLKSLLLQCSPSWFDWSRCSTSPFFHLGNAFAPSPPFSPSSDKTAQGTERSLPQGSSSLRKISGANRLINLIRHVSLEDLD